MCVQLNTVKDGTHSLTYRTTERVNNERLYIYRYGAFDVINDINYYVHPFRNLKVTPSTL